MNDTYRNLLDDYNAELKLAFDTYKSANPHVVDYSKFENRLKLLIASEGFNSDQVYLINSYLYDKYHAIYVEVLEKAQDLVELIKDLKVCGNV